MGDHAKGILQTLLNVRHRMFSLNYTFRYGSILPVGHKVKPCGMLGAGFPVDGEMGSMMFKAIFCLFYAKYILWTIV